MKSAKRVLCALLLCAFGQLSVSAEVIVPTTDEAADNEWMGIFSVATNHAFSTGTPLVMVWSMAGCKHCNSLKQGFLTDEFQAWQENEARPPLAFCLVEGDSLGRDTGKNRNSGAVTFASTAGGAQKPGVTDTPIVALVWRMGDATVKAKSFPGQLGKMPEKKGTLVQQFMASVDEYYKDYLESSASTFACGNTPADRLEAEETTEFVQVPLKREFAAAAKATTERLEVVLPGGGTVSQSVVWAAGEEMKLVDVETQSRYVPGGSLGLRLYDDKGKLSGTNAIAFVAARENNPKNPLWIGERDESSLKAGEWTMDYDLVQAKGVFSLTLVGGSLWCPDCVKTDAYLIDTPVFRNWVQDNSIYCAAIDVPSFPKGGTTCLLTYDAMEVSARYVNATVPPQEKVQSGAGYLSRHGVPQTGHGAANAQAVFARNLFLTMSSVAEGGLCRPECLDPSNAETGSWKTGVPCLIVRNRENRILGRLFQFSNVSPSDATAAAAYVQRLDELLALDKDPTEELNRHWSTVTGTACDLTANGAGVSSDISAIDTSDFWRLKGVGSWARGTFVLRGEAGATGEDNVRLVLWKKTGASAVAVASKTGNLRSGVTLADQQIDASCEWFVQVEVIPESASFKLEVEGNSRVSYSLQATAVADPGSAVFVSPDMTVKESDIKKAGGVQEVQAILRRSGGGAGVLTVPVLVDGSSTAEPDRYDLIDETVTWLDGEMGEQAVRILVYDDPNADGTQDLILAVGDSRFKLTIIDDDKSNPGKISISDAQPAVARKGLVIAEEGTVIQIGVSRLDGASGAASATLTADAGRILDDPTLSWGNRASGLKWRQLQLPLLADAPRSGKVKVALASVAGAKIDTATRSLSVQLIAASAPRFAVDRLTMGMTRYVCARKAETVKILNVAAGEKATVSKLSGTVPSGVKITVRDDELVVDGAPTGKGGHFEAVYQVKKTVNRKTVPGLTISLVFELTDFTTLPPTHPGANPSVAATRRVGDLCVLNERERSIVGIVQGLSINQRGKLSAKYKCAAGTVSLGSAAWDGYNPANGTLTATLTTAKSAHALELAVARDGSLTVSVRDPALPGETLNALSPEAWSASNPAEAWQGYYTVDFCNPVLTSGEEDVAAKGDAVLTLKMTTRADVQKGQMRYAGVLPNGQGFSGSGSLVRTGADTVALPLFYTSKKECFYAAPQIKRAPATHAVFDWPAVIPHWEHVETQTADGCFGLSYQTAGSAYDSAMDLEAAAIAMNGTNLRLFEAADRVLPVVVTITPKKPVADSTSAKACMLKLNFSKSTGLVNGTFRFMDESGASVSATYKGVVMPDWDGCPTCGSRPWASGAFWYNVKIPYLDAFGRERAVSVKSGDMMMIEAAE